MEKKGSVIGGVLLITGSCVGAGMLGLPIITGLVGFYPSLLLFAIACFFMTSTALLVVEVDQWFEGRTNFITMVTSLLGPVGRVACWFLYLFLFYAILVAYIAGSGQHFAALFKSSLPVWVGSVLFVILFGWVVYLGTRPVDLLNRGLMFAKILVYLILVGVGFQYVSPGLLTYVDVKYSFFALPLLIISFGFQNMIPTLSHYLGGDIKRIKQSIIGGALFTLLIYIFWQIIALGSLPIDGDNGILSSFKKGVDAAVALQNQVNSAWIGTFASLLAFVAILTSFLAQTLTLVHFLGDGMRIKHDGHKENIGLCLLALVPPLVFAIINPSIFYKALNFAGGICAVVIFGVFPVLMVWRGRYFLDQEYDYRVRGGKPLLGVLFFIAIFIVFYQLTVMLGLSIFPVPS